MLRNTSGVEGRRLHSGVAFAVPDTGTVSELTTRSCFFVHPLSPLAQDQLRMLPPQLAAVTLSGSVSTALMASTLDDIIRNRIKIVFLSPERLASSSFRRLFRAKWNAHTASYERRFPKVSLLCVDEAHCLSQWAHNFRPSFLRLRSVIELVQPESILAVTATASVRVIADISQQLRLDQGQVSTGHPECGVLVLKTNRDNIDVSAFVLSTQEERLNAVRSRI
jgi:ATP-dependent DNA helicase Q4